MIGLDDLKADWTLARALQFIDERPLLRAAFWRLARAHYVDTRELIGRSRMAKASTAREELYFVLVDDLGFSTTEAGVLLGKRDHATVLEGARKFALACGLTESAHGTKLQKTKARKPTESRAA